jgi:hypothetical protein
MESGNLEYPFLEWSATREVDRDVISLGTIATVEDRFKQE